jgi:hypothetical protein
MGFDILLIRVNDDMTYEIVSEAYLSYNFGNLRELFDLDALNGLTASQACKALEQAIDKMQRLGIQVGTPNPSNESWAWGVRMTESERKSVLLYHVVGLLEWVKKHSDSQVYLVLDFGEDFKLCDGRVVMRRGNDED